MGIQLLQIMFMNAIPYFTVSYFGDVVPINNDINLCFTVCIANILRISVCVVYRVLFSRNVLTHQYSSCLV